MAGAAPTVAETAHGTLSFGTHVRSKAVKEALAIPELSPEALDKLKVKNAKAALEGLRAALGESGLFWRWKGFPIELPVSVIAGKRETPRLVELFQPPPSLCQQPGALQKLSTTQLESVRTTGAFEADSGVEHVPNRWTVARLLIVGTDVLRTQRYQILAAAYGVQRFTWTSLWRDGCISVYEGLWKLALGGRGLIELFVGWGWMVREYSDSDIDASLKESVLKQILSRLDGGGSLPDCLTEDAPLPERWSFTDERGAVHELDFSFFFASETLWQKLKEADKVIKRSRVFHGTERPWLEMQTQELIEAGLPAVLVALLHATSELRAAETELSNQEAAIRTRVRTELMASHPIRRWCEEWVEDEINCRVATWRSEQAVGVPFKRLAEANALERLKAHKLGGHQLMWWIHILATRLSFYASAEAARLKAEMASKYVPEGVMSFTFLIWRPENWVINEHKDIEGKTYYTAEKSRQYVMESRIIGWRLWVFAVVLLQAANNGCYFCMVSLLYGPVGIKALYSLEAFYPAHEIDPSTGALRVDSSVRIETLCSRLQALWGGIASSRREFDAKADVGVLSKSFTRPLNLLWNYMLVGFLGTSIILIGQPVFTIVNVAVCAIMLAMPFFWAPVASLLVYFFCMLVYDVLTPHGGQTPLPLIRALFMVCVGALEAALAVAAIVVLPPLNLLLACLGLLLNVFLLLHNLVMFHCVVRFRARVPKEDSFLARRTAGPGLSAQFYYQVPPAVALAALQQQLELAELDELQRSLEEMAGAPERDISTGLHHYILAPFGLESLSVSQNSAMKKLMLKLKEEREERRKQINDVFSSRRMELLSFVDIPSRRSIRQSRADMMRAEKCGASLVRKFAEERWFPLLSEEARRDFWNSRDLASEDWKGLAIQLFNRAFSAEFCGMPLEDMDAGGFWLDVSHVGLQELLDAVISPGAAPVSLDPLTSVTKQAPKVKVVHDDAPCLRLVDILDAEPTVPAWALRHVFQRKEGWGAEAVAASGAAAYGTRY